MCQLTDQERREYGIQLATTLGDMENVEAEKKKEMDHFKDRLCGLQARADELSRKVRDGKEWRGVDCVIRYSQPDDDHKQVIRLDTGEVVRTALMTQEDRQLVMPLDDDDDVVYQAGEEDGEDADVAGVDGPEIVDADDEEGADERESREQQRKTDDLLSELEKGTPKLKRRQRLAEMLDEHGADEIRRFASYSEWNEPDKHLLKIINETIAGLDDQSEPEGASDY